MKTFKIKFLDGYSPIQCSIVVKAENEDKAFDIWMHIYEANKIEGESVSLISIEEVK